MTNDPSLLAIAIQKGTPILIRGLTNSWPGSRWSFQSLNSLCGDIPIKALIDLPATGGILKGGQARYEQVLPFRDFVELAHDPRARPCYLGYLRPGEMINGSEQYFGFSDITPSSNYSTDTRLWIGSKNTCSGLHSDLKDNLFAQVQGVKTVYLVPFDDTRFVYPYLDNIVNSRIDCERLDLQSFPKYRLARVIKLKVRAGDLMFIPRGWWHYLKAETPSISVNHWFGQAISGSHYLRLLVQLGPKYMSRTLRDFVAYSMLGRKYKKEFFFTPPSTGERLFNYLWHGDFSQENDPTKN
ncbi:cupin-like domain-containing protein [Pseudomonas putida]